MELLSFNLMRDKVLKICFRLHIFSDIFDDIKSHEVSYTFSHRLDFRILSSTFKNRLNVCKFIFYESYVLSASMYINERLRRYLTFQDVYLWLHIVKRKLYIPKFIFSFKLFLFILFINPFVNILLLFADIL